MPGQLIQCVGGEDALLLPPARGIRLRAPLTVTHRAEGDTPGMNGNGQSVRAYQEIGLDHTAAAALLPRPISRRIIFAAGATFDTITEVLADPLNAALAAVTTVVDVTGLTSATSTWTPPAGFVFQGLVMHQLGGFVHVATPLAVDWELTTSGALLFPGYAFDLLHGSSAIVGSGVGANWTGSGNGFAPLPGVAGSIRFNGTATLSVAVSALSSIDSGAGALMIEGYVP